MTFRVKHNFQSAKTDGVDTTLVQPSNWNADHDLTMSTGMVLGRQTAGTGPVEEIPIASVGGVNSVAGKTGAVTLVMADISNQRIGTAKIFVQVGGSPPAMNDGDICVIL